jgi:hypothetical protein
LEKLDLRNWKFRKWGLRNWGSKNRDLREVGNKAEP